MDIHLEYSLLLQFGFNFALHRVQQWFLKTNETQIVNTNYGKVMGVKRRIKIDEEQTYYAFESIPFAKPPVGDLKFRAPQPPDPWEGIKDCRNPSCKPMQRNIVLHMVEGSEDCLYLNVYVKKLNTKKPLPVMVWIYGGGFQIGEASRDVFGPDYFMTKDVVLVCISYRVGPLGFISFDDPDIGVPGNAGIKDQILALQWVKNNITHFNGDDENITVFAESAGAISLHIMMLSDAAKGLFHKAIMQSGSAHSLFSFIPENQRNYRLAKTLGYTGINNEKDIFKFLLKINSKKLYSFNTFSTKEEFCDFIFFCYSPVIEPYVTANGVLCKPIDVLLKEAWGNKIPVILGGNSFEGLLAYREVQKLPFILNEIGDCRTCIPRSIREKRSEEKLRELGLKIKKTFFGLKEPSLYPFLDLLSYSLIWHDVYRTFSSRLQYSSQVHTYLYRFDFDSPFFNHVRIAKCGRGTSGVCHADDLSYLFVNFNSCKLPKDSREFKTIQRMIDMWTSFATSSDPNCASILPAKWKPADPNSKQIKCLNISDEVKFINFPEVEKLTILDEI